MKIIVTSLIVGILSVLLLTSCDDASAASHNLSKSADMFEIPRRIVFYNGITGDYMLVIEGYSSIKYDKMDNQLEVVCKTGPGVYKKHFLGISDNVTYFAEQLEPASVSTDHYRIIFKPSVIVPDIDIE